MVVVEVGVVVMVAVVVVGDDGVGSGGSGCR